MTAKADTASGADDIASSLDGIADELKGRFTKTYSSGRLEQALSLIATLKMSVIHLHDEEVREEDEARKDGVVQKLVLSGRNMSEAKEAVERGER